MIANHHRRNEVQDGTGCLASALLLCVHFIGVLTAIGISLIIIFTEASR